MDPMAKQLAGSMAPARGLSADTDMQELSDEATIASELMAALKASDADGVAEALKSFVQVCSAKADYEDE
jgi:hypothetical protein